MYAKLGDYIFENLIGFDSMTKTSAEKFAAHEVIEGKPILQHVGADLDEIRLSFLLHSRFCVPEDEIRVLNALKSSATILPFVTGAGEYQGDFVIESIDEDTFKTDSFGNIIEIILSISLLEHARIDIGGAAKQAAIDQAFATDLKRVVPIRTTTVSLSAGSSVLESERNAASEANAVIAAAGDLETNPSKFQQIFNSIKTGVDRFKKNMQDVNDKFQKYQQIKQMVEDADAVIDQALRDAEEIKNSAENMDLGGTIQNGKSLNNSIINMERAFVPLKAFTAGRGVLS